MRNKSNFLLLSIPLALVLLALTIYQYGYLHVQSQEAELQEQLVEKKIILRKSLNLIAEKPGIEANIAVLNARKKEEAAKIIAGQTPSLAAATLQEMVKGIITMQGGIISSERIEKPEDLGKFKVLTVAVDAVMPNIAALSDALWAIETQTPSIVIRELDASIRNQQSPKDLMIRMKVSGLTGGEL